MQPGDIWSTEPPRQASTQANTRDQSHGSASGSPDARQSTTQDATTTQEAPGGRTIPSTTIPSPMDMQPMLTPGGFDRQFLAPMSPMMNTMEIGSGYIPFVPTSTPMSFGFGPPTTVAQQQVSPTYQALQHPNGSQATQYPVGDVSNGMGFDTPFLPPSAGTSGANAIPQSPFAYPSMATPSSCPAAAPYIPMSPAPTTSPTAPSPTTQQDMAALASLLQQLEQLRGATHEDTRRIKDLTTSEVAAYATTLNRVGLEPWLARFLQLMKNKHPKVAELLCMTVSQKDTSSRIIKLLL